MKRDLHLLVIDPQNDFCDLPDEFRPLDPLAPGARCEPALPVPGAHADMVRLASAIDGGARGMTGISVTLDSHHRLHIAHPTFWQHGDGSPVAPFTVIAAADLRSGRVQPRHPRELPRALAYLDALEALGRYQLMVWPVHCEIGSWGHNVHPAVRAAYNRWEDAEMGIVAKFAKGWNPWTEHYSAVMAEVPDPDDPATQVNRELIAAHADADLVFIAGEAGSHCVKATTEHLAERLGSAGLKRLVLVTDCISPVVGFESQYAAFIETMTARGLQTATAADVTAELAANARR